MPREVPSPSPSQRLSGQRKTVAQSRSFAPGEDLALRHAQVALPLCPEHAGHLALHLRSLDALSFAELQDLARRLDRNARDHGFDPLVVSGSANFSEASTKSNDENMLVIRGNTRVADMFLCKFMCLFNHFHSRNVRNALSDEEFEARATLASDDSWTAPCYKKGSKQWNERLLFAGSGREL